MYKLLLCCRYLRTRYLAMVCIVSVMLGVATLIVVNSVMAGFSTKLRERLHGLLSDVVVESYDIDGFADAEGKMELIRRDPYLRDRIQAMAPVMEVFAILQFNAHTVDGGTYPILKPVRLIGVDPVRRAAVGGFAEHLVNPLNREHASFEYRADAVKHILEERQRNEALQEAEKQRRALVMNLEPERPRFWNQGQWYQDEDKFLTGFMAFGTAISPSGQGPLLAAAGCYPGRCTLPQYELKPQPPPAKPSFTIAPRRGIIVGYAIAHFRKPHAKPEEVRDIRILQPGDKITVLTVKSLPFGGGPIDGLQQDFIVVDYVRTEMSEYDANYVFVPLDYLQQERRMEGRATSIQIRLRDYSDAPGVVKHLQALFPEGSGINVQTWEDKQGPLLAAIRVEKGILNVLLFMIIAVAGFGILAIFSMIVHEKTRDIGILKALGASNGGVLKIFVGYGLLLGLVGAGLGTALGITFTVYINEIEHLLSLVTGQNVFPPDVYYFDKIPTDIQPWSVVVVNLGAVGIAVLFSILPALRAALLHPVRALRYE